MTVTPSSFPAGDVPPSEPRLTEEDTARSWDRSRVHQARGRSRRWLLLWLLAGPGILAMLGENDGPSMIAYASDGAQYGLGFFVPLIPVLFAMAFSCQEMCMRVGAVTHRGFGELVLQRYGRVWGWFGAGDLILTNLVTLVAEFVSIRVGLAYFHLGSGVAVALGLALVVFTISGGRYWRWERIVLGLALFNGLFLLAAVLARPHLGAVVRSSGLMPFPGGSFNTLLLLLASTVGATVTPWMIFFQQSASADKGMTPRDVKHGRYDTAAGAVLAAIFGVGALIAGAALLTHNGSGIQGFAGAGFPEALRHVAGGAAGTVFALGLIEAGAVAILTICASTAYAAGECVGVSHSFNTSPRTAAVFHTANIGVALLAAVVILIPGAPLLSIALNANVLATALLPVSLVFMVMLANDAGLMGPWANKRSTNAVGITVIAFVGLCGAAYGIDSFLQVTHLIG
ncbi:MAG TPA: divalent metal cation transporter [Streptosporangiaceae bacterium]|nr:divalent metal cation transporter [Streptosporangiaceae bacterium]